MRAETNRPLSRRTFAKGLLAAASAPTVAAAAQPFAAAPAVKAQEPVTVTFWQFSTPDS